MNLGKILDIEQIKRKIDALLLLGFISIIFVLMFLKEIDFEKWIMIWIVISIAIAEFIFIKLMTEDYLNLEFKIDIILFKLLIIIACVVTTAPIMLLGKLIEYCIKERDTIIKWIIAWEDLNIILPIIMITIGFIGFLVVNIKIAEFIIKQNKKKNKKKRRRKQKRKLNKK